MSQPLLLTRRVRDTEPWSLCPKWLEAGTRITDHAVDVTLTVLEEALLDTWPFQRLRDIRWTGNDHLVYPSSTESVLAHMLRVLAHVQRLLDILVTQSRTRARAPDLFEQWRRQDGFDSRLGRAVVLARLAVLMRYLPRVPQAPALEPGVLVPQARNTARLDALMEAIAGALKRKLRPSHFASLGPILASSGPLQHELRAINLRQGMSPASGRRVSFPFVADLIFDALVGADSVDAGLTLDDGLLHHLVVPGTDMAGGGRLALEVTDVCDARRRLAQHWRGHHARPRWGLHAREAADLMVARAVWLWIQHDAAALAHGSDAAGARRAQREARRRVDGELLRLGDEALLLHLARLFETEAAGTDAGGRARLAAIAELASAVPARVLFRLVGSSTCDAETEATRVQALWGSPAAVESLEVEVAEACGIAPHEVLLRVPPPAAPPSVPELRLYDGKSIQRLVPEDGSSSEWDGTDRLWAVAVFLAPRRLNAADRVLAHLADRMRLPFARATRARLPGRPR
jgi:hypothetical protein